jgi:hypothetical protein
MNTIRKSIVAAIAVAVAVSFLPPSAFAKKSHKAKAPPCSFGQTCTDKPAKISQATGWVTTQRCSYESHKMNADLFPCYWPSGACPAATCKAKK